MPETETVVPQDNTKVDEPVKTDKEVIAEEEAAQANEVRSLNIFCVGATEPYVSENIFTLFFMVLKTLLCIFSIFPCDHKS